MHAKSIWWKSALTAGQMVQFIVMNSQAYYLLSNSCQKYPPNITMAYLYYIVSLLFLFANFFVQSYIFKKKGVKKTDKKEKPN